MKYAIVDQDGVVSAFYDTDIHTEIPDGAVEMTDAQWKEYLSDQHMKRFVGGNIVTRTKSKKEKDAEENASVLLTISHIDSGLSTKIDALFDCLINKGIITGDEPELSEIKSLVNDKKAEKAKLK